ncbi:MAG: hypothetical protein KatS3mg115_0737 [Candidatus Poribacteria bacterium]|nr:MAG: hypothetical protein KatS3mg115_0737 [Candidatus Poribacteria bacterium]
MDQATNLYRRDHLLPGISTGLPPLDELLAGLNRSDLIIVAARPSMGKSAFAHNIAAHVAIHQKLPVALFSLEMSQDQIALRILARESGIPLSKIRRGDVSNRRLASNLRNRRQDRGGTPFSSATPPAITMWEIRSECRRLKLHHPDLALVIVDYLQLISRRLSNRSESRTGDLRVLALAQGARAGAKRAGDRPLPAQPSRRGPKR